jgi:hypothetical protein
MLKESNGQQLAALAHIRETVDELLDLQREALDGWARLSLLAKQCRAALPRRARGDYGGV